MDLREKWLAVHPAPPQDLLSTFLPSGMYPKYSLLHTLYLIIQFCILTELIELVETLFNTSYFIYFEVPLL